MPLLYVHPLGSPLDGTQLNNNFALLSEGLFDQGAYIISGLTFAAGTGLAVDVAPGVANIGGRVTVADPFSVTGLTPSDVNYIFLLQDGTGASNTTGTPPADSVLLGTATTDATTVTSVDLTGAGGRQQFISVQSHIHGGSAGNPRAVDLAQWHATNDYGNEVKGVLPAGAVPAVSTFDGLSDVTVAGAAHGAIVYKDAVDWEDLPPGTNGQVLTTHGVGADPTWETPSAGVTDHGALTGLTDDDHAQYLVGAPAASARNVVQPTAAAAVPLTLKGHATQSVPLTEWQDSAAGVMAQLTEIGELWLTEAPADVATEGLLNLGPGGFTGGIGHFSGLAGAGVGGTLLAANAASTFAGNIADFQKNGARVFSVSHQGQTGLTFRDASTTDVPAAFRLTHRTSATPAAGFGVQLQVFGQDDALGEPEIGNLQWIETAVGAGVVSADLALRTMNAGTNRERLRLGGDGRAGLSTSGSALAAGVLFNLTKSASVALPAITTYLQVLGLADTGLAASTEASEVVLDLSRTVTFATGALANQRAVRLLAPTLAFAGASVVTNAASLYIDRAPQAGANATITNAYSLWVDDGSARFDGDVLAGGLTIGTESIDPAGAAQGAVLYRNATEWVPLAAGTSGQILTTNGAGANPSWENAPAGGATMTMVTATLTRPANQTAYTAGDEMTDTGGAVRTLTDIVPNVGDAGAITRIICAVSSNSAVKPQLRLWIYDTTNPPNTDNTAFEHTDGEQQTLVGFVDLVAFAVGDPASTGGNFTLDSGAIWLPFVTAGSNDLFTRVQVMNAYTSGAASDTYQFRCYAEVFA